MPSFASTAHTGAAASGPSALLVNAFPLIFVLLIFYFLFIKPQQRQERERRRVVDNLKVGDRVLTQGGVYGTVAALKGASVILKIADNVKAEFARASVTQVFAQGTNGAAAVSTGEHK